VEPVDPRLAGTHRTRRVRSRLVRSCSFSNAESETRAASQPFSADPSASHAPGSDGTTLAIALPDTGNSHGGQKIMISKFKKISAAIGLMGVMATVPALATWSQALTISTIEVDNTATGSATYVMFTATPTGKPACATSLFFGLGGGSSGSADAIKAQAALATAAFLAGKSVKVNLDSSCDVGGFGRVSFIQMQ
jgi:hypothetical protein